VRSDGKDPAACLRRVPPREFVAARKALAERLARSGRSVEAREVARLPRPSPVVWALNQAALAKPRVVSDLVDAVDRLRRAQLGQGDPRAATAGYRTVFEDVVKPAREALQEHGMTVSPSLDRRLRGSLLAAVVDRGLRRELAAGRLTAEHAEPGFSVLSSGPIPAELVRERPAKRSSPKPAAEGRVRKQAEAAARRAAQADARAAQRAAREAARAVAALDRAARRKERAAQAAERRVEALRATLREHEARSAALRTAAAEARRAHGRTADAARRSEPQ
jgi:hypothetical protein